jgi:hypothetical protein
VALAGVPGWRGCLAGGPGALRRSVCGGASCRPPPDGRRIQQSAGGSREKGVVVHLPCGLTARVGRLLLCGAGRHSAGGQQGAPDGAGWGFSCSGLGAERGGGGGMGARVAAHGGVGPSTDGCRAKERAARRDGARPAAQAARAWAAGGHMCQEIPYRVCVYVYANNGRGGAGHAAGGRHKLGFFCATARAAAPQQRPPSAPRRPRPRVGVAAAAGKGGRGAAALQGQNRGGQGSATGVGGRARGRGGGVGWGRAVVHAWEWQRLDDRAGAWAALLQWS